MIWLAAVIVGILLALTLLGVLSVLSGAVTQSQGLNGSVTNSDGSQTSNTAGFPQASYTFSIGTTGAGQANLIGSGLVNVVYGSPVTYDLTSTTLNNYNTTDDYARVKILAIQNLSANAATTITIQGGASNPFNGWFASGWTVTLAPGESLEIGGATASGQVISGTHKTLKITNNDSTPRASSVAILLVGANA